MKFRFHRGGLEESMKTVVEVKSIVDLARILDCPSKIEFEHIGMDDRINWDTYYVIADNMIVGMSDSNKFDNN